MTSGLEDLAGFPALDTLEPVGLDALDRTAPLRRRFDTKYVVDAERLPEIVAALSSRMRVLEVDGRRVSDYVSTYFDTPDLRTYRDHIKRRRRRFKIRTRHYGDPWAAVLEVKLKGRAGRTIKYRKPHVGAHDELGAEALAFVATTLRDVYDMELPEPLAPVASTRFRRSTLVDMDAAERVTIDRELLIVSADGEQVPLGDTHAVVEAKSLTPRGNAYAAMTALGLRPIRISKYCVGIAASGFEVPINPWLPVLRRMAA